MLDRPITVPSRLVSTPANCDYRLSGFVRVSSTLVIDPGVRVVADKDAIIRVDGGQIIANGSAESPIVMEGLNPIAGWWKGIHFTQGRESSFDHFHLRDAGQVCNMLYCPEGALILDGVTVSLTNSSISNSYVHGLNAVRRNVAFVRFENNQFYGNAWSGIIISPQHVAFLDAASDYLGQRWRNGSLIAIGTADARITFQGSTARPGHWDGIVFWDSNWDQNEFAYVTVKHSGNTSSVLNAWGGVRMKNTSSLKISHSHFEANAQFAIACDAPHPFETITLTLSEGNSFSDNGAGDIDPNCPAP